MADAFSSTAQDLDRGRLTEIDALNGYVARRGAELGIPVPVNHALFTLVKLAEQKRRPLDLGDKLNYKITTCEP
jgi:2-dehydropantoate 2-reductase